MYSRLLAGLARLAEPCRVRLPFCETLRCLILGRSSLQYIDGMLSMHEYMSVLTRVERPRGVGAPMHAHTASPLQASTPMVLLYKVLL